MIDYGIINDFIYPKSEINRIRKTVRAILVNDKKEIGLIHILGKDKFGDRNHYETLGGGVNDNEDLITSLIREVKEEAGYTIKNIKPLGKISIEYFILNRIDEGNFFYIFDVRFCQIFYCFIFFKQYWRTLVNSFVSCLSR